MSLDFNDAKPSGYYASRSLSDPDYIARLKDRMEPHARAILARLWPNGRIQRNEFVVGSIHGEKGKSFKISLEPGKVGVGMDFADGEACGDLIDCWALGTRNRRRARGKEFSAIVDEIEEYLGRPFKPAPKTEKVNGEAKEQLGPPTAQYHYTDASGVPIATVYRYDFIDKNGEPDKTFRPWTVASKAYGAPKENRPLYNQPGIAAEPWVVFVEGEKAAEALIQDGIPATCAMSGSKAPVDKTDWTPLAGKHVVIWPDADEPGATLATNVQAVLQPIAASVSMLEPPAGKTGGWDAADAIAENLDVRSLLNEASIRTSTFSTNAFKIVDWSPSRFSGEPPPRQWLVKNVIPLGCAGVLAAMGDAGKGVMTLDLALKVACRTDTATGLVDDGLPVLSGTLAAHGAVVIFTAEDSQEEVHRRLHALDPTGIRFRPDVRLFIVPLPNAGGPIPLVVSSRAGPELGPRFSEIKAQLLAIPDLKLVVFDPLASFVLGDLNRDQAICSFATGVLSALATETGAAVLACHHMTKGNSKIPIMTPEQARDAIRGQAAIVDGVRLAYALWPAETKEARAVCRKLGVDFTRNRVWHGAVAKSNAPADREIHTFVRDLESGLLRDRTEELTRNRTYSSDLMAMLVEACKEAAEIGVPFCRTGANGLHKQRSRLPVELTNEIHGEHRLVQMAEDALEAGYLVLARAKGSTSVTWLDVPEGPFAKGIGEFEMGSPMAKNRGGRGGIR